MKAIEFAKWLLHTDDGLYHYDYTGKRISSSIGFSPYDCYVDNLKTIEELYEYFEKICEDKE